METCAASKSLMLQCGKIEALDHKRKRPARDGYAGAAISPVLAAENEAISAAY